MAKYCHNQRAVFLVTYKDKDPFLLGSTQNACNTGAPLIYEDFFKTN
ncbi:MAG: hypothetical protein BWX80_03786 [Candidatus Hydrogenedentes bacterium ADurb.Bin101]|nr:MAG: hypothetical protein BWX80_03786 [Candidatus Hydrogenedentes bacterium ADurb.Bin101]